MFGAHVAPVGLYISVTEINHNAKDRILEVSCKIFTNDLEAVLEKMSGTPGRSFGGENQGGVGQADRWSMWKSISGSRWMGKPVLLHFVGSEQENDGTWSYFQVNDVPAVKRIDAVDELLVR
jgi:hypothetical protein